jgi:hypothetical protein
MINKITVLPVCFPCQLLKHLDIFIKLGVNIMPLEATPNSVRSTFPESVVTCQTMGVKLKRGPSY